jgi:hypothetical protein
MSGPDVTADLTSAPHEPHDGADDEQDDQDGGEGGFHASAVPEVLEAYAWKDNAALIAAAFDLHVWPKRWAFVGGGPDVMDVTHGRGLWWTWKLPSLMAMKFTSHDIRHDGVDFRHLPEEDASQDVVCFDPDYVAIGGRDTSKIPEFNDRYGLTVKDYETPAALQMTINDGVTECARVLRPQGILMVKCATYVSSGKPWLGEYHTIHHGIEEAGLKVEDIFVHISGTGPQPLRPGSRQQHARSNSSRLIVFRKPGRRTRRKHVQDQP